MATIFDVADYFRWRVDYESGDNMTHLKLQKLCCYAQAWHVTFTDERLFPEEFQHWEHGPANYELFRKFRENGWRPIDPETIKQDFSPADLFSLKELDTLAQVWDTYGDYGAKYLELLTHQEDPWKNTSTNEIITVDAMRDCYSKLLEAELKKNRIPAPKKKSALPSKGNNSNSVPKPSVGYHFLDEAVITLNELEHDFLLSVTKQCKVLCSLTWDEIAKYKGLGWDKVPQNSMKYRIPPAVGLDSLYHIKVSRGGRIWGYREGDVFQLIWFDPFHKVTPE